MIVEMSDFVKDYLRELTNYPDVERFHSIKSLERLYFYHNPDKHVRNGAEAAKIDLPDIRSNRNLRHSSYLDVNIDHHMKMMGPPQRTLIAALLSDPEIQTFGFKRGRVFGHIDARPKLPDEAISDIIRNMLIESPTPHKWSSIYPVLFENISEIHRIGNDLANRTPELRYSPITTKKNRMRTILNESIDIKMAFEMIKLDPTSFTDGALHGSSTWITAIWPDENKEYDLSHWIKWNYSEEWFDQSSSNIQRILKKDPRILAGNGKNGLRRGFWKYSSESLANPEIDIQKMFEQLRYYVTHINDNPAPSSARELSHLMVELEYLTKDVAKAVKFLENRINETVQKAGENNNGE